MGQADRATCEFRSENDGYRRLSVKSLDATPSPRLGFLPRF